MERSNSTNITTQRGSKLQNQTAYFRQVMNGYSFTDLNEIQDIMNQENTEIITHWVFVFLRDVDVAVPVTVGLN